MLDNTKKEESQNFKTIKQKLNKITKNFLKLKNKKIKSKPLTRS